MTTNQLRLPFAGAARAAHAVGVLACELYRNVAAIADVVVHARSVQRNVQKMADLLSEARRIEAASPERAEFLRRQARELVLA